jgi:hypothetical protein
MFRWLDIANYSTMTSERHNQNPVGRNQVDQPLKDSSTRLSPGVATHGFSLSVFAPSFAAYQAPYGLGKRAKKSRFYTLCSTPCRGT